jgi:hypothetical protein
MIDYSEKKISVWNHASASHQIGSTTSNSQNWPMKTSEMGRTFEATILQATAGIFSSKI